MKIIAEIGKIENRKPTGKIQQTKRVLLRQRSIKLISL